MLLAFLNACTTMSEGDLRVMQVERRIKPGLELALQSKGMHLGDPAFIRIFKESHELELWMAAPGDPQYRLFKTYRICAFSGGLGPKQAEGDLQAPEGFYTFGAAQLNPVSRYHLAFNIGYPNALDRSLNRTGSLVMVHGDCVSKGCFAMTDAGIEEIYLIIRAGLAKGETAVPVHVFPFRMTPENRLAHAGAPFGAFWDNLAEGYDAFEQTKIPPVVEGSQGHYIFGVQTSTSSRGEAEGSLS